ncbi:MAG: heavy metal transporter [Cyclobacteriaceae bacterium]
MKKLIKSKLPTEYGIGILMLLFGLTFFLSGRLFEHSLSNQSNASNNYFGMFLASLVVIAVVLILWEEVLFPIKITHTKEEVVFRNHRSKLKIQVLLYLIIPVTIGYLILYFDINLFFFAPWAIVCLVIPVAGKLVSGINNYHDFLRLTDDVLEYKNNEKIGAFKVVDILAMKLIQDEDKILSKLQLSLTDQSQVVIDLDEMELEEFYESIEEYITQHFADKLTF